MNIFLLDDSDALERYISKAKPAGAGFKVFCVDPSYYGSKESLDDFFHAILNKKVWRIAGNVQGEESQSLKSLMGNASEKCLFLIYVNLKPTEYSTRQDQEGIELLKHIRLTDKDELGEGRNTHVVLYSFEDQLELLKRKPGNLIMLSEGVTFLRLPDGLNTMATPAELVKLADSPADVDRNDFKRFVQCDFQPPDSAHEFSNWWGIRQLVEAAKTCDHHALQMPTRVANEIRKLENKKARVLYEQKPQGALPHEKPQQISNGNHRVLHIDDESEWSEVLVKIIQKDSPQTYFKAINKDSIPTTLKMGSKKEKADSVRWVNELLNDNEPTLVLVDLRLHGVREAETSMEKTSGAIVATMIRDQRPGTPIILMTASNKAWVFEKMMKLGVDAYWMKEGIGDHLPPGGSLKNYIRLKELIATALEKEYQFLREIVERISELKRVQDVWWETQSWVATVGKKPNKDVVYPLLSNIVLLIREYLHLFEMKYGYTHKGDDTWKRAVLLNAVLMESRKVIETIHDLGGRDFSKQIEAHGDTSGRRLFSECSWESAHVRSIVRGGNPTNFNKIINVVQELLSWLKHDPRPA